MFLRALWDYMKGAGWESVLVESAVQAHCDLPGLQYLGPLTASNLPLLPRLPNSLQAPGSLSFLRYVVARGCSCPIMTNGKAQLPGTQHNIFWANLLKLLKVEINA